MRHRLSFVAALALATPAFAQPVALPSNGLIREYLMDRIDVQHQGVGMVVGVIDASGRRIVIYGRRAAGDATPLDGETMFEIGSISKAFTSLLLADMVQRGEVALTDPISKYLPPTVKAPSRGGQEITLVDLDPEMTGLFKKHPMLTRLNANSLNCPRVRVINADAFPWLDSNNDVFDFAVVDFPDPTNYSLGKLYTTAFYRLLARHVSESGFIVVQSTSPMFARKSFWCIDETIKQSGYRTFPYHAYVPSFGEWGFVMASRDSYTLPTALPSGLRFLAAATLQNLFEFPSDMARVSMPANHLNDQVLVRTLESEWRDISR